MGGSIRLFGVRGIDIRMHVTFPLILVYGAVAFGLMDGFGLSGAIFGVLVTAFLFAIVVLHELGHSFAALYYGVPVKEIVLLPIGGVAQLSRIPEEPAKELFIAIAGPAVNFALALLLLVPAGLTGQTASLFSAGQLLDGAGNLTVMAVYRYVFFSNLFLGVFNLLPAFPMDGGRVLRALLAIRLPYPRATKIAVSVGQTFALLLGLWGFLQGGFFLILIAFFVFIGAGQEGQQVQLRHVFRGLTVAQAFSRHARVLTPVATLQEAVDLTLSTFQSDFPICDGERLVGLLTYGRLVDGLHKYGPATPVAQVMETDVEPVSPEDLVIDVQQRMRESNHDALPVADAGRFLGLITNRDVGELYRLASSGVEVKAYERTVIEER